MKYILIILFFSVFYSCMPIHKTAYVKDGKNSAHLTIQPDTCRKSRLIYVYWHYKGQYKKMLEAAYRDSINRRKQMKYEAWEN